MKKIGILVNSVGYGGNERSAVNIAKTLSDRYDVSIIIQEDCGNHYGYEGKVLNLDTPCADSTVGKVVNSLRRIIRLKRMIRENHFDTLFIILPVTNPINYLRFQCRKIVSCRHCGDLMLNIDKYIKMTRTSDYIVCNSMQQMEYLSNAAPDIKERARTIYNIVDIDRIERMQTMMLDEPHTRFMADHQCIVSTGRLVEQKGFNNLLKAFSILSKKNEKARLIIIGDGDYKERIQKMADALQLSDKVLLTGYQDNPFKFIAKANAFVLASFYEGFPNTLVEAMACGVPVIATDCPSGPAEILCGNAEKGSVTTAYGILTEAFTEKGSTWDPEDINEKHMALASAMESVLTDKALAGNLAEHAKGRVRDFSAPMIANQWSEIL